MEVFEHQIPLYRQIVSLVKRDIVSGTYAAGDRLPSIRDMALQYEVTPNTIQRALQILEQEGLLYTERTNGKYVTRDEAALQSLRGELLAQKAAEAARELLKHGYTPEEILHSMEEALRKNEPKQHCEDA